MPRVKSLSWVTIVGPAFRSLGGICATEGSSVLGRSFHACNMARREDAGTSAVVRYEI
jgi:hypothetical protein